MMGWVAMFVHQGREIIDIPIITWSSRSSSEAVGALPFGHIVYPAAASSCGFRRSMYFWYLAPLHFTTCSNMPVHVTLMVWCSLLVKPKSCKSKVWAKRLSTLAWLLIFLFSPWSNREACIIRTSSLVQASLRILILIDTVHYLWFFDELSAGTSPWFQYSLTKKQDCTAPLRVLTATWMWITFRTASWCQWWARSQCALELLQVTHHLWQFAIEVESTIYVSSRYKKYDYSEVRSPFPLTALHFLKPSHCVVYTLSHFLAIAVDQEISRSGIFWLASSDNMKI